MIDRVPLHLARADDTESTGELSDADLEQVVGGLSRVWHADTPAPVDPAHASLTVTLMASSDALQRIPA